MGFNCTISLRLTKRKPLKLNGAWSYNWVVWHSCTVQGSRVWSTVTHTHTYTYTHAHTYTHICTHTSTYTHTHIHTYMYTCIQTYIYIHTHIHKHTRVHVPDETKNQIKRNLKVLFKFSPSFRHRPHHSLLSHPLWPPEPSLCHSMFLAQFLCLWNGLPWGTSFQKIWLLEFQLS